MEGQEEPWLVERHRGSAADLHAMVVPDDGRRRIWVLEPDGPAVVLGSTQDESVVDAGVAAAEGVAVVRRRSGGGAVWVEPGEPVWVDVVIPRGDPLWTDDVGRAFLPVGRAWQDALRSLGVLGAGSTVHEGRLVSTRWSGLVCFAGVGPGEVLAGGARDGAADASPKVVGLSQRRTRAGARFQCALPRRWDPAPLARLLADGPSAPELAGIVTGIGDAPGTDELVAALVAALGGGGPARP